MRIAILKERAPGENRVAATPETVKKFTGLGATVAVETGAGVSASIPDDAYADADVVVDAYADAEISAAAASTPAADATETVGEGSE